ncbi:MAG TPA: pentapeptide repeat-containing protein [Alphaproteobacteria bacterium]|jgi:uncharacterized protein YjbI with pentapeptide repeats|nr:pentapeptide repeat-containing protein [Alphaproteobacteria bacterium]|tara:strand:+ start:742 stop:1110 length:369 start_codon:yes stop_codon:yes gene_type:complete
MFGMMEGRTKQQAMRNFQKLTALLVLAMALCGSGAAIAFDETDLKKFQALNACAECDLSGADLVGAKLYKGDLSEATLRGADLSEADLSEADLSTANLKGAKIDGAILCKSLTPWGEDNPGY